MAVLRDTHEISVIEASQRLIVTRRHSPVAAVVGIDRLTELENAASDLNDLALVLVRGLATSARRTSLDDVLNAFGHTRESLASLPDDSEGGAAATDRAALG